MRKTWVEQEVKELISAYKNPTPGFHKALQSRLGRTRGSIDRKARSLNLTDHKRSGNRIRGLKKSWVIKNSPFKKGKDHIFWNGGKYIQKPGYILIYKPDHPHSGKKGYVRKHRLIMEKALGRYLKKNEAVHHKNGDKGDNRLKNLQLIITGKMSHLGKICCPFCEKTFLIK